MKLITILSDFGSKSGYPAQMKGVILNQIECKIIDITHEITPYKIQEGAFVLKIQYQNFQGVQFILRLLTRVSDLAEEEYSLLQRII